MAKVNWFKENVLKGARAGQYKALRKAAGAVAKRAKANCPVGIEIRGTATAGMNAGKAFTERMPGTLKKSIRVKVITKKGKAQVIAGNRDAYYAGFVEFGTGKMLARPYMRPALQASKGDILLAFSNQMD